MMTEEELQQIEERASRATPGPWDWRLTDDPLCLLQSRDLEADADFIAHVREDVPALVAEIRRLQAQVAALSAEQDCLCNRGEDACPNRTDAGLCETCRRGLCQH